MSRHRALFLILCLPGLLNAASPRNDASRSQQLEANAAASIDQPHGLVEEATVGPVSLLSIMRHLQRRPAPVVAAQVQLDGQHGQSAHERQMLADMGKLESELESWRQAEENLEQTVQQQASTVQAMKGEEARAIHDEQVAAVVWWDCKMLMCVAIVCGIIFCIYSKQVAAWSKPVYNDFNAAEPVQQAPRRVRPQPEFVEKNAQVEAEDMLMVSLPPIVAAQSADLEAAVVCEKAEDVREVDHKTLPEPLPEFTEADSVPMERKDSEQSNACQYFNMAEEPVTQVEEDAWWNESSAGY